MPMTHLVHIPAWTPSEEPRSTEQQEYDAQIFAAAVANAQTAAQLWWQADGNYVANHNDPMSTAVLDAATTSYALTVLVAFHAQAVLDEWAHPGLWVEVGSDTLVDNDGYIEICNDGPTTIHRYQGSEVDYVRADDSGISVKCTEF